MEIPDYEPFYIQSVAGLRAEIARLGLEIPLAEDTSPLAQPLAVGGRNIPNRFCAQPISGGDAAGDGSPSALTRRRYRAYAAGAFGLVWMERTSALETEKTGQLCLSATTVSHFGSLVAEMKTVAVELPVVMLQVAPAQPQAMVAAARLALEAGFDGVDLQGAPGSLPEIFARVRAAVPGLLLATRLCAYDGVRGGFGVSASDFRNHDLSGPMEYVARLVDSGLQLLNLTSASPCLLGADRGLRAKGDYDKPDEHPLTTLARQLALARAFRVRFPGVPLVGSGLSWPRQFVPLVASGAVGSGWTDLAGLGRSALACPDLPARVLGGGTLDPGSSCMVCFACSQMERAGRPVGCVLRDADSYGAIFRDMRRLDGDRLLAGAARCHLCEGAPCVAKSPTRTDIPAFIKAFREGREREAYEVIRAGNPLPEMVSETAPAWQEEEGACIETTLNGEAVPIRDLQYVIAWRARDQGLTGVRVPAECSGKNVAVVGGGPAGTAAAVRLLELGHRVHIHETAAGLGGVVSRLLAKVRSIADPGAEIDALLRPARDSGRLGVSFGSTLGTNIFVPDLLAQYDSVLVAVGLWKERSLGVAEGVVGALDLLEQRVSHVPRRVAVLAGGDSAMDACLALRTRRAAEIYVIFGRPRSEMHWHMAEGWFANPGVHTLMNWEPLGYETDGFGKVRGVQLRHAEFGLEMVLKVDLVVEAMGLEPAANILPESGPDAARLYTVGAMVNGGASVGQCVAEGLSMAEAIHGDLLP